MVLESNMHVHCTPRAMKRLTIRRIHKRRRMAVLEDCTRPREGIERRICELRRLVPSRGSVIEPQGLFREAAEYIAFLKTKLEVMKVLVKVLLEDF